MRKFLSVAVVSILVPRRPLDECLRRCRCHQTTNPQSESAERDRCAQQPRSFRQLGPLRLRIPTESGHLFRLNPGTRSDESGHPWKEALA